jgi:hypothetical protein
MGCELRRNSPFLRLETKTAPGWKSAPRTPAAVNTRPAVRALRGNGASMIGCLMREV